MNIVIAIDSFKGSLSSIEAGNITAAAIRDILPEASTQVFPLAIAKPILVAIISEGTFHGVIRAQTPTGSRCM